MIKCIIFDFDGTLVGGIHVWIEALGYTLSHFGIYAKESELEEEFRRSFIDGTPGSPWRKIFSRRCPGREDEAWTMLFDKLGELFSHVDLSLKVRDFLEATRFRGTKMGIITFRSHESVENILSGMNASHLFDIIIGSGDTSEEKPSPQPFLLVSERMNVKPSECLVIGDEPADIIGGNRAGMHTIGVLGGVSNRDMLRKAGADLVIDSIEELPDALAKISS